VEFVSRQRSETAHPSIATVVGISLSSIDSLVLMSHLIEVNLA
jgi:hypothetical protein